MRYLEIMGGNFRGARYAARCAMITLICAVWLVMPQAIHATQAPPVPGEGDDEISAEPDITIIQRDDAVIEEYRISNRLYMIKVIPAKGIPYYLVDTDGDGSLDVRRTDVGEDMMIPSWTLFRW